MCLEGEVCSRVLIINTHVYQLQQKRSQRLPDFNNPSMKKKIAAYTEPLNEERA